MTSQLSLPGRALMVTSNLIYSVGAYAFDWNETHVLNPNWPPHARFHNGQTMSLSVLLTSMSVYLLSRRATDTRIAKDNVMLAALIGSFYCAAGFSAILYPGTDWKDHDSGIPYAIQIFIFGGQLLTNWLGFVIESARLDESQKGKLNQRKES